MHGLEPADLPHLTDADLIAAGLDKPLHRKRVYRHAREECGPEIWRGSAGGSGTAGPAPHFVVMGLFWLENAPMDISHPRGPARPCVEPAG